MPPRIEFGLRPLLRQEPPPEPAPLDRILDRIEAEIPRLNVYPSGVILSNLNLITEIEESAADHRFYQGNTPPELLINHPLPQLPNGPYRLSFDGQQVECLVTIDSRDGSRQAIYLSDHPPTVEVPSLCERVSRFARKTLFPFLSGTVITAVMTWKV